MTNSVIESGPRTSSAPPAAGQWRQGRLAGPSQRLDRRINVVRDDLADAALAGAVVAPRYAEGVQRQTIVAAAMLHATPDIAAVAVSQLLFGEAFVVFDVAECGDWAWGQCLHDGYVGWTRSAGLAVPGFLPASHTIVAPTAAVFAEPDIKARVRMTLPLNARIVAEPTVGSAFVAITDGGYVHSRHVRSVAAVGGDPVALALGFVGTPYVWGGRTRDGIDCSGLTQAVLRACGVACPRDADQQAAAFPAIDPSVRTRGDLVIFPGHVGILVDAATLLHANAHAMATVVEPLAAAAARLAPTGFHRPPGVAATSC